MVRRGGGSSRGSRFRRSWRRFAAWRAAAAMCWWRPPGIGVGAWSARPSRRWTELMVAGILLEVAEGRGFEELTYWVEIGRDRALQPPHTASAGTGRRRFSSE